MARNTLYCIVALISLVFIKGQSFEAWILPGEAEFVECDSAQLLPTGNDTNTIHLLRFDVFLHDGFHGVLPIGFIVTQADLLIPGSNVNQPVLHEMTTSWNIYTKWTSYPNDLGPVSGVDYIDARVGAYNGITNNQFTNISVTPSVAKWADRNNVNRGWIVKNAPENITCNSTLPSSPVLHVSFTPLPFKFTCYTYKDPLGELRYPEPFIAYTRLCTFCVAPLGFEDYVKDLNNRNDGTVTANGVPVFTKNTKPINGTDIGFCINVPPGLKIKKVTIERQITDASKGIRVAMDTVGYTTLLPDQIGCQTFECKNETQVVIDGDITGAILNSDTVLIRSNVKVVGNFSVQGSISIESSQTVLDIQGCLSATQNISISLQNQTYKEGQLIMEVFAQCDMAESNFVVEGGLTEMSCDELRVRTTATTRGVLLTIAVDKSKCGGSSSSDVFGSKTHIIVPVVVVAIVVIAAIITAAMYFYRWQKFSDFSISSVLTRTRTFKGTMPDQDL